jgi:methionine biosynthesis protein MetW
MIKNSYNYDLDLESKNSLSIIVSKIRAGSTVLEFGPANGRMTRYLKEVLSCKVYGVEIDAEAARECSAYTEAMIVGDIENLSWLSEYGDIQFDTIVFADVLEHLYDPLRILKHAATLLRKGGEVFVSIPNITHNSILLELLQEQFTYRSSGLLDSTHMRFFSKKSFEELVSQTALKIVDEDIIFVSPEMNEMGHRYEDIPCYVADFLENRVFGEAYQLIFTLRNDDSHLSVSPPMAPLPMRYGQLFIDCGGGFGENIDTVMYRHGDEEVCLEFDISGYERIVALRFDPLNRCATVRMDECVLFYANGESLSLDHTVCNARFTSEGRDYFTTYDPIYHLKFGNTPLIGGERIRIRMEYHEYSYTDMVEMIIAQQANIVAQQANIIAQQANVIAQQANIIAQQAEHIVRLEERWEKRMNLYFLIRLWCKNHPESILARLVYFIQRFFH